MSQTDPTDKYTNHPFFREHINLYVAPEEPRCKNCKAFTRKARCPYCLSISGVKYHEQD